MLNISIHTLLCCNVTATIICIGGCTNTFCNIRSGGFTLRKFNGSGYLRTYVKGTFPGTYKVSSFYKNQTQQMKNNIRIHLSESPTACTVSCMYITRILCS